MSLYNTLYSLSELKTVYDNVTRYLKGLATERNDLHEVHYPLYNVHRLYVVVESDRLYVVVESDRLYVVVESDRPPFIILTSFIVALVLLYVARILTNFGTFSG